MPVVGVVIGWLVAVLQLHQRAEVERRTIRHAVGLYLELTAVALSGGAGPSEALQVAASGGSSQIFAMIAAALGGADAQRRSPYEALNQLGHQLAVPELTEIGSAMALAEQRGAPVGTTLENKAASLRFKLMTMEETRAESMSTVMSLPSVLMLCGFLLFLMFPFIAALLATTA